MLDFLENIWDAIGNVGQTIVNAISNFIDIVVQGFTNIINFIQHFIEALNMIFHNTFRVIQYLLQALPKLYELISTLPIWLVTIAQIIIGISVAYLILGRSAGKSD